ncbi:MAG: hypothetical protein K2Z81_28245, partial [Cyanobacteria bacterium]|nr:hypothetical protein [Cyanobacteriota bacterium]
LNMQDSDTLDKMDAWTKWLKDYGPKVEKAMKEEARKLDPSKQIFYGEVETKGVLYTDAHGKPEIVDPHDPKSAAKVRAGKEFNLLAYGFTVKNSGGKIEVEATVQPKYANIWNYMNIMASHVGNPIVQPKQEFGASDPVAIRHSNGEVSIVRGDELSANLAWQRFRHYGHKVVTATMDIGMLVSSGGTLCSAAKAGQLTLSVGIPAAVRATLGASGFVFNSAWAKSNHFLHGLETARGLIMLADVAQGTLRSIGGGACGAMRWLRGTKAAEGFNLAKNIEEGLTKAEAGWGWWATWKTSEFMHYPMEFANLPFGLMLYDDMKGQIRSAGGHANHHFAGRMVGKMIRDGRETEKPPETPEELKEHVKRASTERLLDTYGDSLTRGADAEKTKKIKDILETTKKLLPRGASDEERNKFKSQLLEHLYGSAKTVAEQIKSKQSRDNRIMSDVETRTMKAAGFDADPDVKTASAVALLLLSGDGKSLPKDGILATRTLDVPSHKLSRTVSASTGRGSYGTSVEYDAPATAKQNITTEDVFAFLKTATADKTTPMRRMVTGDLLVRTGLRSPISYASILKDNLASGTTEDRTASILQLGPMINSIQMMELSMPSMKERDRNNLQASLSGNTSKELLEALKKTASSDSDKDVRALAGSVIHALGKEFEPKLLENLIVAQAREHSARRGTPGSFAEHFVRQLNEERSSLDTVTKLNAVVTLGSLGDLGGLNSNKAFNTALLETMSSDRPDAALLALRELRVKDPIRDLTATEREKVLHFLDGATTKDNANLKIEIAGRIEQFCKNDAASGAALLSDIIDSTKNSFARDFPDVQVAAIKALARLNRTETAALIMKRANPTLESNGKIRHAAVSALGE